ncbi:MAG: S8 family serine peptidase, partial [Candidatus Bathyarchaeota archaeon]|nr:S8 family serine peptidase [Candidatus Bathyarchaeota archaeon]
MCIRDRSGTSHATAHVVGVTALILSAKPWLTPQALIAGLVASAKPFKDVDYTEQGAGFVDAYGCLRILEENLQPLEVRVSVEYASGLRSITLDRRQETSKIGSRYYKVYGNYTLIGNGLFHLIISEKAMLTWLFYGKARVLEDVYISILPVDSDRWITQKSMTATAGFKLTSFTDRLWSGYADLEYGGLKIRIETTIPINQPYIEFKLSKISGDIDLLNVTLTPSGMLGFLEAAYLGGLEGIIVWDGYTVIGLASTDRPYNYLLSGSRDAYTVNPKNVTLTLRFSDKPIKIYIAISSSYREVSSLFPTLIGRSVGEAFLKPIEIIRIVPPGSSGIFKAFVRNLGPSRNAKISMRIKSFSGTYDYGMDYHLYLDGYTDNYYEFRLPKLPEGFYKVCFELENLPWEIHRSYDTFIFDLYVGLYPKVVASIPSRIDGVEKPFIFMYPGDIDYLNVTLISSTPISWVKAYVDGNASLILRAYSTKNIGFQVYTSIYGYIPDNLKPAVYNGSLIFEGSSGIIASIPVSIDVREPIATILWHDRLDFIPGRNDLYLWYTDLWKASALKGIRMVPASLHIKQPRRIDLLILPDPYYGYQDIRSTLDYFLDSDGSAVILAGPAIFALKYGYRTVLEEYGLKAVKEPYYRWSNSSVKLDLRGFEELAPLILTVAYGVLFDVSTPIMGGSIQVMFRAIEVGLYGFLNVSSSFYSSLIYRDLDGKVKLFVHSSVFSFDDLWCKLSYNVRWDIEEGRLIGYVEPVENATAGNIDLLSSVASKLSNKPPRILSLNILDSRVEQMFESYTVIVVARDEETGMDKLNVTLEIVKPNGSTVYLSGSYIADGTFTLSYTPGINDPIGVYQAMVRVEDKLHAYVERSLKFEVIPPIRSMVIILLLVGLAFTAIGYIL